MEETKMNIKDVDSNIEIPENIWESIFNKQWALALKYKEIEGMGDLLETLDNNINTAKGQKWIKDFAWRITEELAEGWETKSIDLLDDEMADDVNEHYKEEIIDGLHFLVELTQIAGYTHAFVVDIDTREDIKLVNPWPIIYNLGLLCNTLKNKPWKQTQMLTDKNNFNKYLSEVWYWYLLLLKQEVGTLTDVYLYYFKKQEVNKFRQRSKY